MKSLSVGEIKTQFSDILEKVQQGESFGITYGKSKKLVAEITRVSVEVLGGAADSVDVIITDIKRENWATGGKLWSEPRP